VVGEIVLEEPRARRLVLALLYADQLVKGALVSRLPRGQKLEEELSEALEIIGGAQDNAIKATYALVGTFLWDRFESLRS